MMRRVIFNLAINAAEAMQFKGSIDLEIKSKQGKLLITCTDNGPGIPIELQHRLFEPFATFGKTNGTGLGLLTSNRIVKRHDGRIYFKSSAEKGACFSIGLPVANESSMN